MLFNRIALKIVRHKRFLLGLNYVKTFSTIYDKNVDYFRNRTEYRNSVVQLNDELNESKVAGPGFSFLLKEHSIPTEDYFSHLNQRENVMKLTLTQLKDLLFLMANINIDTSKYATTLKYLDEKCALSAERLSLDLSFYILDAWFIIWGPKTFKKHYYTAITSLWGRKMTKCSKYNLILMLYFVGMSKESPPFLMDLIEDRMEKFIKDFTDEELAVACLSFFKTSNRIRSKTILKQSCKAAENLLLKKDRFNVISILKCLRLSKFFNQKLWWAVKDYALSDYSNFNFVECTNFLATFSSENVYDEQLFSCLEAQSILSLQSENSLNETEIDITLHPSIRCRVKDIARFLWSMSSTGHIMKTDTLDIMSAMIRKRAELEEFSGSQLPILIDCLQSLALVGIYPHDLLSSILQESTLQKLYYLDKAKPKYQLYFIQKCSFIEEPNLAFNMKNLFKPIPKNLDHEIRERKGFQNLIYILTRSNLDFRSCYIMPHIMISGIVLSRKVAPCDELLKRNQLYQKYLSMGIFTNQFKDLFGNDKDYICIELLDPSVCVKDSIKPLGLMKTKIRQLKKLNFKVVTLTKDDIEKLADDAKDCENVFDLIKEK